MLWIKITFFGHCKQSWELFWVLLKIFTSVMLTKVEKPRFLVKNIQWFTIKLLSWFVNQLLQHLLHLLM